MKVFSAIVLIGIFVFLSCRIETQHDSALPEVPDGNGGNSQTL